MPEITLKPIGFGTQSNPRQTTHRTEAHRQLIESIRLHGILQPPGCSGEVKPSGNRPEGGHGQ